MCVKKIHIVPLYMKKPEIAFGFFMSVNKELTRQQLLQLQVLRLPQEH